MQQQYVAFRGLRDINKIGNSKLAIMSISRPIRITKCYERDMLCGIGEDHGQMSR